MYPFQPNLNISPDTSKKLKIISIACKMPITKVCEEIVQKFWKMADKQKLENALKELSERG